jgi:hypothetical protein
LPRNGSRRKVEPIMGLAMRLWTLRVEVWV